MAKHNFCTDALEELKRERQKITIELRCAKGIKQRISLLEKRGELSREIKALEILARGVWSPKNVIETAINYEERKEWQNEQDYYKIRD